jgi:S1-C subfamily serine protease
MTPDNAKIHNEDPNAHKLPEVYGAVVMKVIPGSPADICGIRKNDIITQVNGNDVFNSDDADTTLDQCKPGKSAYVTVARGENNEVVRLEAFPKDLYALIEERKRQHGPMFVIKPPA